METLLHEWGLGPGDTGPARPPRLSAHPAAAGTSTGGANHDQDGPHGQQATAAAGARGTNCATPGDRPRGRLELPSIPRSLLVREGPAAAAGGASLRAPSLIDLSTFKAHLVQNTRPFAMPTTQHSDDFTPVVNRPGHAIVCSKCCRCPSPPRGGGVTAIAFQALQFQETVLYSPGACCFVSFVNK